jgi:hypothetical protein
MSIAFQKKSLIQMFCTHDQAFITVSACMRGDPKKLNHKENHYVSYNFIFLVLFIIRCLVPPSHLSK